MNLLLGSEPEAGAAQSGSERISGTMAPDMRSSYAGASVVLTLPWNPHLSSTPINASPVTAAASYRIPTNSGSSSDNSPSYTPASYQIPRTINTVSNSHADVSETSESPGSQEQGSSDRSRGKSIKRKKADWENQHENLALFDSWKTHFRALKASGKMKSRLSVSTGNASRIFVSCFIRSLCNKRHKLTKVRLETLKCEVHKGPSAAFLRK